MIEKLIFAVYLFLTSLKIYNENGGDIGKIDWNKINNNSNAPNSNGNSNANNNNNNNNNGNNNQKESPIMPASN